MSERSGNREQPSLEKGSSVESDEHAAAARHTAVVRIKREIEIGLLYNDYFASS